jgi:cysteine desulfurase/selenocysteine lyase
MMNIEEIKKDFPILDRKINGKCLVYLDNAATSQKPIQVINKIKEFYLNNNENIHRGMSTLSEEATEMYEKTRENVAKFINASKDEIIFTKNTTESINLAVYSYFYDLIKKNDVILLTEMEHHSNLIPWQILAKKNNAELDYLKMNNEGRINLDELEDKLKNKNVKVLAVCHASNVLGTINPIKEISRLTKKYDCLLVIDGAQAIPHMKVDVNDLGCDFYAFSAHKMLGPTGVGVLFVKNRILKEMKPFITGGGIIKEVTKNNTEFIDGVERFEAGTPNIADVIAFNSALEYLNKINLDNIEKYENELLEYALNKLIKINNLEIYGPKNSKNKVGVIAFNIKGIHAHDVATILDDEGIAIRAGQHCAMPLHNALKINASARISFYFYNTKQDIDKLVNAILKAKEIFKI